MNPGTLFVLEVRSRGVGVACTWNGVEVYAKNLGRTSIAQTKLNPWVIEGENEGRAIFRPVEVPARGGEAPGSSFLLLRVIRGRQGERTETVLSEFEWRAGQGPFPRAWRDTVRIGEAFGRWLWEAAPRAPLDALGRQAILALLNRLRDSMLNADAPAVAEMFRVKNEEMSRALGLDPVEVQTGMSGFLAPFFAAADRRLEPLVEAGLQFREQAQGRLVAILHPDGGAAIRGVASGVSLEIPVSVTRSGRQWVIVR